MLVHQRVSLFLSCPIFFFPVLPFRYRWWDSARWHASNFLRAMSSCSSAGAVLAMTFRGAKKKNIAAIIAATLANFAELLDNQCWLTHSIPFNLGACGITVVSHRRLITTSQNQKSTASTLVMVVWLCRLQIRISNNRWFLDDMFSDERWDLWTI